ncbi:MAG: hypothetical protein HRT37_20125 [Alteromonadaceae bacterium]|nr:hypothetical protein [Alteromonadaceae bacterium]
MKLSTFWLSRYSQGLLEKLWRKLTWMTFIERKALIFKNNKTV